MVKEDVDMSKYADDIAEIKAGMATLLERSANQNAQLKKLNGTVGDVDKRVDDNEKEIARLQERQGVLAGINTALTVIASAVAAGIGLQR